MKPKIDYKCGHCNSYINETPCPHCGGNMIVDLGTIQNESGDFTPLGLKTQQQSREISSPPDRKSIGVALIGLPLVIFVGAFVAVYGFAYTAIIFGGIVFAFVVGYSILCGFDLLE